MIVGGISGAGKSTLARELARRLGAAYVELDAHWHQPGWTEAGEEAFRASVSAATEGERWVVDGNYSAARDILWSRATTFVWPDYARWLCTWRATRRTAYRLATRQVLWNGNRERWWTVLGREHPIRWSWQHHPHRRRTYEEWLADPRWSHVDVVRLRTPAETRAWLETVPSGGPTLGA